MLVDSNGGVASWGAHSTTIGASATAASGSLELKAAPDISSLSDDFNDNSINTSLWSLTNSAGTTGAEVNSEYEVATTTTAGYATLTTQTGYFMLGGEAYVRVASAGNQALSSLEVIFEIFSGAQFSNNEYFWLITNGTIYASKKVNGTNTNLASVSYNASTHAWLKIRESSGTTYWDYSSNGTSWTNFASETSTLGLGLVYPTLTTGTWAAEASGSLSQFDNFNVAPGGTPTPTNLFFF
jgi:hypothetical protein